MSSLLLLVASPRAEATNFGSSQRGLYQGVYTAVSVNADWVIPIHIEGNVSSTMWLALNWSFANNYGTLDMFQITAGAWDVNVRQANYGLMGLVGWVDCPPAAEQGGAHPNHHCADQQMRLNSAYQNHFDTTNEARNVACHELGHTVGLRHSNETDSPGSCMYQQVGIPTRFGLHGHDSNHLISHYGWH